jgi:hypothetical protein
METEYDPGYSAIDSAPPVTAMDLEKLYALEFRTAVTVPTKGWHDTSSRVSDTSVLGESGAGCCAKMIEHAVMSTTAIFLNKVFYLYNQLYVAMK